MTSSRGFPNFNTFPTVKNVLQTHKFITFVTNIFCPSVLRSWSRRASSLLICFLRKYAMFQCQFSPSHSHGVPRDVTNILSHFKNQLLVHTQSQSLQESLEEILFCFPYCHNSRQLLWLQFIRRLGNINKLTMHCWVSIWSRKWRSYSFSHIIRIIRRVDEQVWPL